MQRAAVVALGLVGRGPLVAAAAPGGAGAGAALLGALLLELLQELVVLLQLGHDLGGRGGGEARAKDYGFASSELVLKN